jgi:dolichyl-phosphate-mannose-protein mannosyltransferase
VAIAWAAAVAISGGIVIETSWRRVSSRDALRPLAVGAALVIVYVLAWRRHWRTDLGRLAAPGVPQRLMATLAIAIALAVGMGWGTRIAGGPDASGYVSEATLFAEGALTIAAPSWTTDAPWQDARLTASPVGFRPSDRPGVLAPTYPPGLPLLLTLFLVIGGRDAVFYVVPLLGAALVWCTYRLGSRLGGGWAGAIAALFLVSSPTFLSLQQQVMSDVPVTLFWTAALTIALSRAHPFWAGMAAGIAVLIRPNLAPLAVVPALLATFGSPKGLPHTGGPGLFTCLWHLIAFSLPVAAAVAAFAALNAHLYGSPLTSGYGTFSGLYSLDYVRTNLRQYTGWFVGQHTALVLLGLFAFTVPGLERSRRWTIALVTVVFPAIVFALYVPYLVFQPWEWWYTRFLLPGYPALLCGLGTLIVSFVTRSKRFELAVAFMALVTAFIVVHGWRFALVNNVFTQRSGDQRFARAVRYVQRLPPRTVIVSLAHSGTIRLYAKRDVLRFEAVDPGQLDLALDYLQQRGYELYLVGDDFEIQMFRTRFAPTRAVARMDPRRAVNLSGVSVYRLNATD